MTSFNSVRECVEAISEGLNVLYELAHGPLEPDGNVSAKAEWLDAVERLAVALEHTRDPGIETDSPASPDQIVAARLVAALVADWLKTGQRSEDLANHAGALYEALTA